jgi:hypothetical protein
VGSHSRQAPDQRRGLGGAAGHARNPPLIAVTVISTVAFYAVLIGIVWRVV